jgi:hypothetical protein
MCGCDARSSRSGEEIIIAGAIQTLLPSNPLVEL